MNITAFVLTIHDQYKYGRSMSLESNLRGSSGLYILIVYPFFIRYIVDVVNYCNFANNFEIKGISYERVI